MKKKIMAFTPSDSNNIKYFEMMRNSLRKFHSEEDLPLLLIDEKKIATYKDPNFFYRATPIIAKELLAEYETVIKLDADQIITGPILDALEGDYDVAVVNNSNPRDYKAYPYQLLNIHPLSYVNCGFVVMKSEAFINEWYDNCLSPLFAGLQMREQDLLNLLVHGNHYKVKRLDEGDSFYGLASKQYTPFMKLIDGKIILPPNANGEDNWPDKQKQIRVYHWGGGNTPDKMNYRIIFPKEIVKYIDGLVK